MFGSKDKDKRIQELESDLRAAVVELNRVRTNVREQTFRITCYQQTVDNQNKTIRGQMEESDKLKANVAALDMAIENLQRQNSRQMDQLIVGDATITDLRKQLVERDNQIALQKAFINRVNSVLGVKAEQIEKLTRLSMVRDAEIGSKEATIRQCEAVIASLRKEIESCKNMISAQADGLTCLRTKLSEKEKQIESYRSSNRVAADNIRDLVDEIESRKRTHHAAVENIRMLVCEKGRLVKLLKEKETLLTMQQQTICKREDEIRNLEDASPFATIRYYEDQINALKAERDRLTTHSLSITADYTALKDANGKLLVQLEAAEAHIGRRDREAHEFQSVFLRQRAETDKLIKCVNAQARTIADQKSIIATLSTMIRIDTIN